MSASLRRALLVGIDEYDSYPALSGCINDVEALKPLFARHENGDPNFSCVERHTATMDLLVDDIKALLAPGANLALLYFAGHGAPHEQDISLCTRDGTTANPGLRLSQVLTFVAQSQVPEVAVVLDCCFSGAAGGVPQLGGNTAALRSGLSILAASRGDQPSAEHGGRGVFSTHLGAALDGGAADILGKVTIAGIYAYLSELFGPWDQRPTFKANVDRLHDLRLCKPAIPVEDLRRLPLLFPTFDYEYPLDPSYEETEVAADQGNVANFQLLQRCRSVKLVEPSGEEHMYWAAINSKSCLLTPLGQHYWRLVSLDLL
jgi:hypothetical protein